MTFIKRNWKTLFMTLLLSVIGLIIISNRHPIFLKWITGSARIIGKPINAKVFTNGLLNNQIKVFHIDTYWDGQEADYYILNFQYIDTKNYKVIIGLNIKDSSATTPQASNIMDYDIIAGHLFQSETGSRFIDFKNSLKGYGFDPKFELKENQIKINLPPQEKQFKYDSLRVILIKD